VFSFRPDICDENSLAVTSNGILKEVGKLALTVRNVVTFGVAGGDDYLLEVGQTSVDVGSFLLSKTFSSSLFDAFISGQID